MDEKALTRAFWRESLPTAFRFMRVPVTLAFLARETGPVTHIAAFLAALVLASILDGLVRVAPASLRRAVTRPRSLPGLSRRLAIRSAVGFGLVLLLAFPALGRGLFGGVFGLEAASAEQSRLALLVFALGLPALAWRSLTMPLVVAAWPSLLRHADAPRVLLLAGLLGVFGHWLEGALLGAAAWVAAAWLEGLVLLPISVRALRLLVAVPAGEPTARGGAERAASLSRRLVLVVVAVCLGQGPDPELNLAAFGVAYALAVLMYSPLRGLHAVGRAGAAGREALWVAMRFAFRYVALFAGVSLVVFYSPVDGWLLRVAMGLPETVAAPAEPALVLVFLLAILWGYLALFEGIAAGLGSPPDTPGNLALRLLVALGVAVLAVSFPQVNGAVFAIVALIGAAETQVFGLGWRLFCANVVEPGGSKKPAEPGNGGTTASGGASRAAPTGRQAHGRGPGSSHPSARFTRPGPGLLYPPHLPTS